MTTPDTTTPDGKAWDDEIDWSVTVTGTLLAMPEWLAAALVAPAKLQGKPRVVSIRPVGGGPWKCVETGRFVFADDFPEEGEAEVRIGWGTPGCIERLKEFEGW